MQLENVNQSDKLNERLALQEAQRRLELCLTAANLGIWTYNIATDEFWASDRAKHLHGHQPHEVHTFAEAGANIHPEDRDRAQTAIAQAIQTHSKLHLEYRVVWLDGSIHWISSDAEFIPSSEQGEGIFYGSVQDISDAVAAATQRKRVEDEHQQAQAAIAADLRDTQLLQDLSARLVPETEIQVLYDEIMAAAIALTRADAGTVQILDSGTKNLLLLATQGFDRTMTDHFYRVTASSNTPCGIALATGQRTFVDFDVPASEDADGSMRLHIQAGLFSAQSTPLITRSGKPIGMVSTHWRKHHRPSDRELRFLDLLARQAADLIEQRQAEQALRESEEKYRSLFNSIDEGFCLIERVEGESIDFRYLEANPAFAVQTGLSDVVGKTIREAFPDTSAAGYEIYENVLNTGEPIRFEIDVPSLKRILEIYAFRTEDEPRLAVIFKDITERKRAEAALHESEERQAFLLKLSDALRPLVDPIEVQDAAVGILGEALRVNRCYYAEIDRGRQTVVVNREYLGSASYSLVGEHPLELFHTLVKLGEDGEPVICENIATHPVLGSEANAYRERAVQAFVVMPLVKKGITAAFMCLTMEQPCEWTTHEVQLLSEVAERTWAGVERARAEVALRESEIQRLREQSAREQERQQVEALAELDRAKTLFFSNISHEFRTPLTLLLAPLQDALSDRVNPLAPPQRERLELAHRNAIRLLKLVNTLLDFSRIEAGRMEAVYEPTDLALFTTELASVFRSAIERAGLRLIVDCPPLPEPVYVDREMWEKIVLNLLSNAFKFTLEGEIALRLHPTDDHHVTLQVQDTGTGIPPEELPHVFERFYQVRRTKARTYEGSGIGLALVHELIRLHGGTVDVSSTVGQGSCFTIAIPLDTAHLPSDRLRLDVGDRITATRTLASTAIGAAPYVKEAERWLPPENAEFSPPNPPILGGTGVQGSPILEGTRVQSSPMLEGTGVQSSPIVRETEVQSPPELGSQCGLGVSPSRAPGVDLGGEKDLRVQSSSASPVSPARVLVVDDNADMREYLTRILSEHVQVEAVADGASALAAAQERSPDLVLTDVMMPGLDGFELLKALRANPSTREIPIILLSARAGEESVVEGLEAGADDYLIKPFSAGQLVSRVKGHLQMVQLRLEALHQERTLNRRKDELLSTVSHELNTPLVAILGWTRLLRANPPSQVMLVKALETIERNATLQAKLIQDLLDISRISAGKLRLSLEPVELESVIENAIASIGHLAQAKQIDLVWRGVTAQQSHTLAPSNVDPVLVQGDRDRLQQIITNLLTNAIKFTPDRGSISVELSVIERHNGSDASIAEISITDTGIGISAEFLPHVFDRFRQVEGSHSAKGLGLGLAIARHLVELHNGTIRAESAGVGQGATFIVKLPLFKEF